MSTKIEWTDETWNPVTGCTKISPGCSNCYAARMAHRLAHIEGSGYGNGIDSPNPEGAFDIKFWPERLEQPQKWKKPRNVFVCSMGDLFHKDVPFEYIQRVWAEMEIANRHTYQILTKRPERILEYLDWMKDRQSRGEFAVEFSLRNVWLGVSAENQEQADKRIPLLLQIPATVRFVSCEPLLEPVDLRPWLRQYYHGGIPGLNIGDKILPPNITGKPTHLQYAQEIAPDGPQRDDRVYLTTEQEIAALFAFSYGMAGQDGAVYQAIPELPLEDDPDCLEDGLSYQTPAAKIVTHGTPILDWVIAGCESGPSRRSAQGEWFYDLKNQCVAAGVPFFLKQMEVGGKLVKMPELDGQVWSEFPEVQP